MSSLKRKELLSMFTSSSYYYKCRHRCIHVHGYRRLARLFVAFLSFSIPVSALSLPNAGLLDNQLRQEMPASPSAIKPASTLFIKNEKNDEYHKDNSLKSEGSNENRVLIVAVKVAGLEGTNISEKMVQQVTESFLGRPLTFSDLQQLAGNVTDFLQKEGLLLAQTILEPQDLSSGVISLKVIPGNYDIPQLNNQSSVRSGVVDHLIDGQISGGEVIQQSSLERLALLLGEIPGVESRIFLQSGDNKGSSVPIITLSPGKRIGGYLAGDNQGDLATGRQRVMAGGYVNELLGVGDQLTVNLVGTLNNKLFSGDMEYSFLLGKYGTRTGMGYRYLGYRYSLQGEQFSGTANSWRGYLDHPWVRRSNAFVNVRVEAESQFLSDSYPLAFSVLSGSNDTGRKQINSGTVSVQGQVASPMGGISSFALKGSIGNVAYRSETAKALAAADSAGQFSRLNYQINYQQPFWQRFSFSAGLNGQLANRNLDSSQKILLGGPFAVRAYDIGSGAADQGNVVTTELRMDLPIPLSRWLGNSPQFTVAGFYDQGWGQQYKNNINLAGNGRLVDTDNYFSLSGAGIYTTLADAGNYAVTLTWAHRIGNVDPVSGRDERERFWISAVKTF